MKEEEMKLEKCWINPNGTSIHLPTVAIVVVSMNRIPMRPNHFVSTDSVYGREHCFVDQPIEHLKMAEQTKEQINIEAKMMKTNKNNREHNHKSQHSETKK